MEKLTIVFGVLLMIVGVAGFVMTGSHRADGADSEPDRIDPGDCRQSCEYDG